MKPKTTHIVNIGLMREAFSSKFYPQLFSGAETHTAALYLVKQLVTHTSNIATIAAIIESALPHSYAGNLRSEINAMVEGAIKKGFGQTNVRSEGDPARSQNKLFEAFRGSGAELFHDQENRTFLWVDKLLLRLQSREAEQWLRAHVYTATGRTIPSGQYRDFVQTLDAIAKYKSPQLTTYLRIARVGKNIFVDLGGSVVKIEPGGWTVEVNSPVRFHRPPGFQPLPTPVKSAGSGLRSLQALLNIDDEQFTLVVGFLINALNPDGPFMCAIIEGEQGSGKSVLAALLKRIIDPNVMLRTRLPDDERGILLHAQQHHLIVYDNISGFKGNVSDTLCMLATGGGIAVRQLYTDGDLHVISAMRPFVLNGISEIATRPDLLERAIAFNLPALAEGKRRTEKEIKSGFDRILPHVLGDLYDAVACALENESSVAVSTNVRMIDAARWMTAAEPALKLEQGAFCKLLEVNQNRLVVERLENNPVVVELQKILEKAPFEGSMSELFGALSLRTDHQSSRYFPANASHLSRHMDRLKPALRQLGIFFEHFPRTREGRRVRVWKQGQEDIPAKPIERRF